MPELPELEAIRKYLANEICGRSIDEVKTYHHTVIRYPSADEFEKSIEKAIFDQINRIGRILVFSLSQNNINFDLYVDHGLTGRFGWKQQFSKIPAKTVITFNIDDKVLIYHDKRLHGAIWLFKDTGKSNTNPAVIRNFGPDILQISFDEFKNRLKKKRGEIKGVITNQKVITGIGNAYSDEILFAAKIHPFTKRTQLIDEELEQLYHSCITILSNARDKIYQTLSSTHKLDNEKQWRNQLFKVHLKGGNPCSICGNKISTIKAHHRLTNFCRQCQTSKNKSFI